MSDRFLDVEAVLNPWLQTILGIRVMDETPTEMELPVVRLYRVSGADNDPRLDRPIFDVDVFAADRPTCAAISEQVRTAVLELPGQTIAGAVFTKAFSIIAPRWLPDSNNDLRRYSASYEVLLHKVQHT